MPANKSQDGSSKDSDSSSSSDSTYSSGSSSEGDGDYGGGDVYGDGFYGEQYGGKDYGPGASKAGELLKKGAIRYWFERICISSYHDRRIPELRTYGVIWLFFCVSYKMLVIQRLHRMIECEERFLFDVDPLMKKVFSGLLFSSLVLSCILTLICFLYSFGASVSCPLLQMSSKRMKKLKSRDLANYWFKPFIPWIITFWLIIIIDAVSAGVFPFFPNGDNQELMRRLKEHPALFLELKCCGVLGVEIDYGETEPPPTECQITVNGCKFVVEHRNQLLMNYPYFLIGKTIFGFAMSWFMFGSVVGEPTDSLGNDYFTHGDIIAMKEAASDEDMPAAGEDEDEDEA